MSRGKKYLRRILFLSLSLILVFLISIPVEGKKRPDPTEIRQPVIIKGDWSFPPYEYLDENNCPTGFNVDLTKAIMKDLNLSYTIELDQWDNVMKSMQKGNADLLMGMNYTNARARIYRFGGNHGYIYIEAIYRSKSRPIHSFEELKGKKVLLEKNSISHDLLRNAGYDSLVVSTDDIEKGLKELSEGKYDVAMCEHETAVNIINSLHLDNLEMSDLGLPPQEYRFVGRTEALLEKVDRSLYRMKQNGTYDKLHDKWFSRYKPSRLSAVIYISLAVLFVGIFTLYFFNFMLRKKVKKARLLMERNSKKLSMVLHATGIYVWIYDVETHIFNNVEGDLFPPEGMPYEQERMRLRNSDERDLFDSLFQGLVKGITPQKTLFFRRLDLGTNVYLDLNKEFVFIRDDEGNVKSIIGTLKNVTDEVRNKKRIEELLVKYETLFNSTFVGMEYYDSHGMLISMNDKACSIFGITDKQQFLDYHPHITNSPVLKDYFDIENPRNFHGIINVSEEGRRALDNLRLLHRKGNFYLEVDILPIFDKHNRLDCIIVTESDVTEMQNIQIRLEEEKEKAQQADKLKSAFLANMSHEIRTPLNAIVGFSNLLPDANDEDEKREFIDIINSNSDQLLNLINDILDLSKLESGVLELRFEPFDMSVFFDNLMVTLRQRLTNPDVEFITENPYKKCMVKADKMRMAQILTNYITNAIKYTPSGFIKAGYVCENGGIRLYTEDSGIGIAREKQHLMFQRFEKLDDFAQGTGLGLSICKAIADACDGRVGFTSEKDKGSIFWAWIPSLADIIIDKK